MSGNAPTQYATVATTVVELIVTMPVASIQIMSRDGASEIAFTVDGSIPAIAQNGSWLVPAVQGAFLTVPVTTTFGSTEVIVQMIAASSTNVVVTGLPS